MLSVTTIPMSTIVPIAMAMPDRATTFASTPKTRIATNVIRIAMGSTLAISSELRRLSTITATTMIVISTSWLRASRSVPRVSPMSPLRS